MGTVPDVDVITGQAAFASLREIPWHRLGTVIDSPVSTDDFLIAAKLDALDEKKLTPEEVGITMPFASGQYFNTGVNPFNGERTVLSSVGGVYETFTTRELAEFGTYLTDGAYRWETMGAMNEFRLIFMALVHPDDIVIDPNGSHDVIKRYLMLSTTHDGSGNVIAKETPVRVVCKNTLDAAMGSQGTVFKIRHTKNMRDRAIEAQKVMGFAAEYDAAFEKEMNDLLSLNVSDDKFFEIVSSLYKKPENDTKGSLKKWEGKTEDIMAVWAGGTGSMLNLEKNTGYRAWQALTESAQWVIRKPRAGNAEKFLASGSGFDEIASKFRTQSLNAIKAMV